jgi:DNA primase
MSTTLVPQLRAIAELEHETAGLKQHANAIAIAERYGIKLKRASGPEYIAKCPFHKDKRPSFSINAETTLWICFGCGARGDLYGLVGRLEGVKFRESKRIVAELSGFPLAKQRWTPEQRQEYQQLAADAERLAVDIADYAHGLGRMLDVYLEVLSGELHSAFLAADESRADTLEPSIRSLTAAAATLRSDPDATAQLYAQELKANPQSADRIREAGRGDREHALSVTQKIVRLLGMTTTVEAA